MFHTDYTSAYAGATLPQLAAASRKLVADAAGASTHADLTKVAHVAQAIGNRMQAAAREQVNVASKAGLLPTNYLGIDSERQFAGGIAAGATGNVTVNPAVNVRITGFRTDDTFASDFQIDRIDVATLNLIVGQDGCPASMFTSGIALPPVAAPELPGGSLAEISFVNISGAARRARAAFPVIKLQNVAC